ncbi:MAG: SUMF1/EgtB/PvdO family nonheme iron enzyme [Sedimenticola sp.]
MSKRMWVVIIGLACLSLLIWILSGTVAGVAKELWGLDDATRIRINEWSSIFLAALALLVILNKRIAGVVRFVQRRPPEQPPSTPISKNPIEEHELLNAFYQALSKTCERIDLALVDVKFTEYTRNVKDSITLPVVYQEMDVLPCRSEKGGAAEEEGRVHGVERQQLMDACALEEHRHLIVLGDPGAGKSMFADSLTWRIACSHFDGTATSPPGDFQRLPVIRVRLRSAALSFGDGTGQDHLLSAMQQEITALLDEERGACVWQVIRAPLLKRGVILLDGLDEVPEADGMRSDMLDAIDALKKELGKEARLIITSRPHVFDDTQRYWLEAFSCLELQPMSNGQIELFINNWYQLLREARNRSKEAAQKKAHQLFVELQNRDYLLEPARRPLILTLLTSLHFSRELLPHSRAELYREAVALMLERWTQRIYQENPDYPLDEYERKALAESDVTRKIALQKLALEANRNKTLEISDVEIKGQFSDFLSNDCNANNLLDFIRYRSGILKPGKGNCFEFYHRSFQDYLAALDITEMDNWQDEIEQLLREEGLDWWSEVFLLLVSAKVAGHSKPDAVSLMLRYVPDSLDYSTYPVADWHLLFLACRAAIEQKKPLQGYGNSEYKKLRQSLTEHLLALVAGQYGLSTTLRAEAGQLLSDLGDPRPGVTVKHDNGQPLYRQHGPKRHAIPDIDWQEIEEGEFTMGSKGDEGYDDEKPDHKVAVPRFFISRYLVTNAQYRCFIDAGIYQDEAFWNELPEAAGLWLAGGAADEKLLASIKNKDHRKQYRDWLKKDTERFQPRFWDERKWGLDNHPVVGVSWFEALAYSVWLNGMRTDLVPADGVDGLEIRLPREEEWEYAARGSQGLRYAWGDEPDAGKGNYDETKLGRTSAVGMFPAGEAFGLQDMSGNVWEWTSGRWGESWSEPKFTYEKWAQEKDERNLLEPIEFRIARGGSWFNTTVDLRCAIRLRFHPEDRDNLLGFRVVLG